MDSILETEIVLCISRFECKWDWWQCDQTYVQTLEIVSDWITYVVLDDYEQIAVIQPYWWGSFGLRQRYVNSVILIREFSYRDLYLFRFFFFGEDDAFMEIDFPTLKMCLMSFDLRILKNLRTANDRYSLRNTAKKIVYLRRDEYVLYLCACFC